jgi:glyoxylase-like metal-dependent hydrolase (beta-lactamase superfamily II)
MAWLGAYATTVTERADPWVEIADRIFTKRYAFYDQEIGVILGGKDVLVIDTRLTARQGREILEDLRELTSDPVTIVVDTHWHTDHAFGNAVFRPAVIWGHENCVPVLRDDADQAKAMVTEQHPDLAQDIAETEVIPPDRTLSEHANLHVGDRLVELRFLGRGHTDADIVVEIPAAGVLFAGDLLEDGATPFFGHGYPIDWPETASRLAERAPGIVVPGHGAVRDRAFAEEQAAAFLEISRLAREVHAGRLPLDDAIAASPFDPRTSRQPLERALQQLRGELD